MQAPGRSIVSPAPSWAGCFTYLMAWASTVGFPAGGRGLVLGSPPTAWAYVGSSPRRPPGWPEAGKGPCSPPKHSSTRLHAGCHPDGPPAAEGSSHSLGPAPSHLAVHTGLPSLVSWTPPRACSGGQCPPTASHLHLSLLPPTARLHPASEPASSAPASPSSGSVQAASSCTQPCLHHLWAAPTIASLVFPNSSSRHLPPRSTLSNTRVQVLRKTTWAFGSCLSHGSPPALHLQCQTVDSRYPKPPGTLLQASVQFPLRVAASELSQPKR